MYIHMYIYWSWISLRVYIYVWDRSEDVEKSASVKAFLRFFMLGANLRRRPGCIVLCISIYRNIYVGYNFFVRVCIRMGPR